MRKVIAYGQSPFDRTVFLDGDTHVRSDKVRHPASSPEPNVSVCACVPVQQSSQAHACVTCMRDVHAC